MGNDLDLVAIVIDTDESFETRSLIWDLNDLPVKAELIIYTSDEWD